jgi:hypothetical protein
MGRVTRWSGELVFTVEGVRLPGEYGVVLEAGHDGVAEWQEENL